MDPVFAPHAGVSPITAVSHYVPGSLSSNRVELFSVAFDGEIHTSSLKWPYVDQFTDWFPLPGITTAPCAPLCAVTTPAGTTELLAVSTSADIWHCHGGAGGYWDAWRIVGYTGDTHPPHVLSGFERKTVLHAPLSAVSVGDYVHAFMTDLYGRICHAMWSVKSKKWYGWFDLPDVAGTMSPGAPVAVVSPAPGVIFVFVVGEDNRIYRCAGAEQSFADWAWTGWAPIGTLTTARRSPITAIAPGDGRIHLFVVGDEVPYGDQQFGPKFVDPAGERLFTTTSSRASFRGNQAALVAIGASVSSPLEKKIAPQSPSMALVAPFDSWTDWHASHLSLPPTWNHNEIVNTVFNKREPVSAVSRELGAIDLVGVGIDGQLISLWNYQHQSPTSKGQYAYDSEKSYVPLPGGGAVATACRNQWELMVFGMDRDGLPYWGRYQLGTGQWHGFWKWETAPRFCMTDPLVEKWDQIDGDDTEHMLFFAENEWYGQASQGLTTDGAFWYIISNCEKWLTKFDINDVHDPPLQLLMFTYGLMPGSSEDPNTRVRGHVGAPSFWNGSVLVPYNRDTEDEHDGVWLVPPDLSSHSAFFMRTQVNGEAQPENGVLYYAAVNPLNGMLYVQRATDPPTGAEYRLRAYLIKGNALEWHKEDDIYLERPLPWEYAGRPIDISYRLQGGYFTVGGRFILVSGSQAAAFDDDDNRIHCFSSVTGSLCGAKMLGQFGSTYGEVENVTVLPLTLSGQRVDIHVSETDVDFTICTGYDDVYLHSYHVPFPALL